jgi:hypothetical protein
MYPNMYNPAARHGLYGTHESPSGTILKKDLEIQGLFFRLQESDDGRANAREEEP